MVLQHQAAPPAGCPCCTYLGDAEPALDGGTWSLLCSQPPGEAGTLCGVSGAVGGTWHSWGSKGKAELLPSPGREHRGLGCQGLEESVETRGHG